MGAEHHHGGGWGDHVPTRRTLKRLRCFVLKRLRCVVLKRLRCVVLKRLRCVVLKRLRCFVPTRLRFLAGVRALTTVVVSAALVATSLAPASALEDDSHSSSPRLDAIIKASCGAPNQRQIAEEYAAVHRMLADALPLTGPPPPNVQAQLAAAPSAQASAAPHAHTQRLSEIVAQVATATPAAPAATETPAPVATDTSVPAATDTPAPGESASPEATEPATGPSPSPAPTLKIPGVPPPGPGELIPPTPAPTGPYATPPPLPSTSPAVVDTGPVFIVRPSGTPPPIPIKGASPGPSATPSPAPTTSGGSPAPTLAPNQIVTVADKLIGSSDQHEPSDLIGNVHIFYTEGQIVGDKAHFDGRHTITVTGHTYLINRRQDSILYAQSIIFDTRSRHATLIQGEGESIEGVQQGKLHFKADSLVTNNDGVTHGEHAYFTTCEHPHAGYHVEAKQIDVMPGDKLVAHKATIFLGPTAIFYIPLLIIPLLEVSDPRRQVSFLPLIGYDQAEGFWVKLRIGFGTSNQYYGYYRVEYYTKRGLGLGYTAYIGAKDQHRYTSIDSYTISDRTQNARLTNITINDVETFSKRFRGQFGVQYQGDFGPNLPIPPSIDISASLIHETGSFSTENLEFQRQQQGTISDTFSIGFIDSITLDQYIQQQIALTYSRFLGSGLASDTLHIATNTHIATSLADYNLTYDKTDYSANPFGYDRVPELQILPHITYGNLKFGPQLQFTVGEYSEPQNHFSTSRAQAQIAESVFAKVFGSSDFSANYNLTQDYYGTGDEKAFDQQNASLSTPIGQHIINSLNYNEQHPIGPANVPFQLFDNLSGGSHSAQDTLRYYNKDIYSLSLSTGTDFDRQAQSISYQLNYRPSLKSYIVIGGYYQPGSGNGFGTTNVQAITPFGRDTSLEFAGNVDWHNHNRLTDKNILLSKTVDNCYNMQFTYNQDLKTFAFNIVILAFPGQGAGFGFGGQGSGLGGGINSIIPQNLAF